MREIKFRVFDTIQREMHYDGNLQGDEMVLNIEGGFQFSDNETYKAEDMELTQYTGLKDIYNKEIYEGDILNVDKNYSGSYTPTYVLFYKGTFYGLLEP